MIRSTVPPWSKLKVASWGRYLGFATGPGKGNHTWDKPVEKFLNRLKDWHWSLLGMHGASVIYNMFLLPVLTFVAQLELPPASACKAEEIGLRRVAPGPFRWCLPLDLWQLRSSYHLSFRFRSLLWTSVAAQARVLHAEGHASGGLAVSERASSLQRHLDDSPYIVRTARMRSWYLGSHARVLMQANKTLTSINATPRDAELALANGAPRPWSAALTRTIRSGIQRWIYARLEAPAPGQPELRLRHRLRRWKLPGFPRIVTSRVLRRLRTLSKLVAPRVQAAAISTIFNRWTTRRRFQQGYENSCVLGCGGDDSLEHYLRCSATLAFARRHLGLHFPTSAAWPLFLFADNPAELQDSPSLWTRVALLVYVIYRTTNACRHATTKLTAADLQRALHQSLHEAVRGHPASLRMIPEHRPHLSHPSPPPPLLSSP